MEEGALLAGVIQSPSALDPLSNAAASEGRWNYVMDGMRDMGAIDAQQRGMAVFPQVVEDPQAVDQNVGDPTNGVTPGTTSTCTTRPIRAVTVCGIRTRMGAYVISPSPMIVSRA